MSASQNINKVKHWVYLSCFIIACCGHSCRGSRNRGMKPLRRGGVTAQWHPLCRWSSHFPREFHAFRLYCIDFHAWNSLILKDNIMDAIWCKEWPIFNMRSLVGYSESSRSRRLRRSVSAPTLTCLQLYYSSARWLSGGFHKVTWPSLFLHGVGSPYHELPFQVTAGRWMEQGILGWVVYFILFFLEATTFSSRSRWDCIAERLRRQRSRPDQCLLSVVESRALETS